MQTGVNWASIRQNLDTEEWTKTEPDREERSLYLGSVFNLYPSGKYYMPFACSNVEVCEACANAFDGPCDETSPCIPPADYDMDDGPYHCEVCKDQQFGKLLEEEAEQHGLFVTCGEGDPCDILVGECRDVERE